MAFRGPCTDVGKEIVEGLIRIGILQLVPVEADSDSTSAIMVVGDMRAVVATLVHHQPDAVFLIVNGLAGFVQTATMGFGILPCHVVLGYYKLFAALAAASPPNLQVGAELGIRPNTSKQREMPELSTGGKNASHPV